MQGARNLTEGPIMRQLFKLSLPIMGTSFIQMAYSLTDMAWVGHLGSESVAAIGAVGILAWMTTSISYLNKVGSEVCVGQAVGVRDEENARRYAAHNITIALIISLVWSIPMCLFAPLAISFFSLEASIAAKAIIYLRIVSTAFPFIFLTSAFAGIYNASGLSKIPFYISGSGLLLNMVLDPLFIFGFHLGTTGAAIATWIAEAVVCLLFIIWLKKKLPLFGGFAFLTKLKHSITVRIVRIGLPVAMLNTLFSIINLLMARTASAEGGYIGVMALTAGGQIEAIAWNTAQGFSTGLSAFVAQNYAARAMERVLTAIHNVLILTSSLGVIVSVLFIFLGGPLFSLFVPEKIAWDAGGLFLRIDGYSMILMMVEITMQGFFYGTGRTIPPAIISITFNSLRIPMAILFTSLGFGIAGVWWAISASSMMKGITSFIWFEVLKKRVLMKK
jgi:putative MATE family efflux protein